MTILNHGTSNNKNLIVFVHGFIGGEKTWIKEDGTKPFIDLLINDSEININFDIGIFEYHTELLSLFPKVKAIYKLFKREKYSKNLPIDKISLLLESQLRYTHAKYEKIVLIGHSMGGLVGKRFILNDIAKNSSTRVKLYVSLATPHSGSTLATFGNKIITNFQIKDLKPLSESITAMNDEWVKCKQLPKRLYGQGLYDEIVPQVSSVSFDRDVQEVIYSDDDHFSIITPKGKSVVIDAIIGELHELLKEHPIQCKQNDLTIPKYIKVNEIIKDLTATGEYEIDMSKVIGRENDLKNLKEKFNLDCNKITVLKSIGGIGKTTLLKGYVKQNKNDYNHIIWVYNQNGLVNSFVNNIVLLENLNFSINTNISEFENYQLITNAIKKLSGKTLLLIDDLKDDDFETYSKLPISANCQILGTTRINLTHAFISQFNVDSLGFDSAKILFSHFYTGNIDTEVLKDLFDFIGYHTLTIELLAKTLETNFMIDGLSELIEYLKNDTISNENWQVAIQSEYDDETVNLKKHLLKAFTLISLSTLETQILSYFSIVPTLQFDGKELINLFSIENSQSGDFAEALESLVKKGWITKTISMYQMHAIVQEVIKVAIPPKFSKIESLIDGLCSYLDVSLHSSISAKIKYISCSQHVLNIINEEHDKLNTLNGLVALGLNSKGDFQNALEYANKSLKYVKKKRDDHKVYEVYSMLGIINRNLGNFKESYDFYQKAIDLIESLPEKYITSLHISCNFATLLEQIGEQKYLIRAKELYEYVLDELTLFLKDNTAERHYLILLATTSNSLGKIHTLFGKYEKAIEIQQNSYNDLLELLGSNHEIVGISANNLGLAYGYNKDFINSLKYHEISVSIQENALGKNHPELAISKSGLANAYRDNGEIKKAKSIFKEVLDLGEKNLSEKHPTMARRKANYAVLCDSDSEKEIAIKLYFESIDIDAYHGREKSPDVAISHLNLGILFMKEEDWNLAYKHLNIAKEIFELNKTNNEFSSKTNEHLEFVELKL